MIEDSTEVATSTGTELKLRGPQKQVRIHEANSRVYWAGAVMPENHEKSEVILDRQTDKVNYRVALTRLKIFGSVLSFEFLS